MLHRAFAQFLEIVLRDDLVEVFLRQILRRSGARCSVVGSSATALIALYGLLSPPISLIGRSWTTLNPIPAAQSINCRNASRSPMPRSVFRAKREQRRQHSRDLLLG